MKVSGPILIFEPRHSGHRLAYVATLIRECKKRGLKVVVVTSEAALSSDEWQVHLSFSRVEVVTPQAHMTCDFLFLERVAKQRGASRVIVLEGDAVLLHLVRYGWRGSGTLACLVMRPEGQSATPLIRTLKSLLKSLLMRLAKIRSDVEIFRLASPLSAYARHTGWLPDPASLQCTEESINSARETLTEWDDRFWVGLVGSITARKNPVLVVEALKGLQGVGLVVAGQLQPELRRQIQEAIEALRLSGVPVVARIGTLDQVEFDSWICALDAVVVAHSNEGPSGIVLKAALAGRKMVLAGAKSLRRDAKGLGGLAVWTPLDAFAIRSALLENMAKPVSTPPFTFDDREFSTKLIYGNEALMFRQKMQSERG